MKFYINRIEDEFYFSIGRMDKNHKELFHSLKEDICNTKRGTRTIERLVLNFIPLQILNTETGRKKSRNAVENMTLYFTNKKSIVINSEEFARLAEKILTKDDAFFSNNEIVELTINIDTANRKK